MKSSLIYRALGFSIIPVARGGKKPLVAWKEFTTRHPTEEELTTWFDASTPEDGGPNIGIVTGSISNLVVADVDGPTGEASLLSLGEIPETATVRTGKGRHLYFRHPGGDVRNFTGKLPGLDLRGDGGFVVAPPSVHTNGNRYEWERHPGEVGIAEVPESLMTLIQGDSGSHPSITPLEPVATQKAHSSHLSRAAKRAIHQLVGELLQASDGNRNDTLNRTAFQFAQYCAAGEIDEDWARSELLYLGQQVGLPTDECLSTINSGFDAGLKKPKRLGEPVLSILDIAPDIMDRPIRLIKDRAYGATWVPVGTEDSRQAKPDFELVVFGKEGGFYSEREITGSLPLSDLPFAVDLPHKPMAEKLLSPEGLRRWINQDYPNPADVFDRITKGVDAFVSFEHSLSDQRGMCELVACWIIGTYALDAFDVVGYPWPTGERGSGKTQLLNTVSSLAYLGRTITSGSSFAAIRDEAHYGATIAFDDCENVRNMDNDKRELLLAGNMRGTVISLKEPVGDGEWKTRYINNFAPRLFSSIGLPDPVLGSRTISIPLIASTDKSKTRRNPSGRGDWPVDRRKLIDDLWLTAVLHLSKIGSCDKEASDMSDLHARGHDIWRIPLAIAWWLQKHHGVDGVFDRVTAISVAYQKQVQDVQGLDSIAVVLMTLSLILDEIGQAVVVVETKTIAQRLHQLSETLDQVEPDVLTLDANRIGKLIGRLGFAKGKSHSQNRGWTIDRKTLETVAKSRSILLPSEAREVFATVPPLAADNLATEPATCDLPF